MRRLTTLLALLTAVFWLLPASPVMAQGLRSQWPVFATYDVKGFCGMTGNGSTDDTAAGQNCENLAEATVASCGGGAAKCGGMLIWPCGNYSIATGPITMSSGTSTSGAVTWRSFCGPLTYSESASYSGATLINTGGTVTSATVTATIASPAVFTGATIPNGTLCWLENHTTGGYLPGGFSQDVKYYVVATSGNTFELSLTSGGTAINSTGSQAGTHTVFCGKNASVTVTSASPAVVTDTTHGLRAYQPVFFNATTMPTGLTSLTEYFVSPTGLTSSSYQLCAAPTVGCASINTSSTGTAVVRQLLPDTVFANAHPGLDQLGPAFYDMGFVGAAGTASLHVDNFMNGLVSHSSFREGAWGMYLEGGSDDSDWVVTAGTTFRNISTAYDCTISTVGGCNNLITESRFVQPTINQIMARCQAGNAQFRFINNKMDGPGGVMQPGLITQCNQTMFIDNSCENPTPCVMIPQGTTGSNNGRGLIIADNFLNPGGSGGTVGTLSCTTPTSGTSVTSCSGGTLTTTASLVPLMVVSGGNVNGITGGAGAGPYVYGTGGAGTATNQNTLTGINTIAAVTSSSALTLAQNSNSTGGTNTLTFCWPVFSWPGAWTYAVVVHGNAYQNFGGCPDVNHGNDGAWNRDPANDNSFASNDNIPARHAGRLGWGGERGHNVLRDLLDGALRHALPDGLSQELRRVRARGERSAGLPVPQRQLGGARAAAS